MRILIAYATTEGQTRKICRFLSDRLVDAGHSVELLHVEDAGPLDAARFDAAILAASVHAWHVQPAFIAFAKANATALAGLRTLYLQVSLGAVGNDPEERADLDKIAAEMVEKSGWTPGRTAHVAGALRFDAYDFLKAWVMRRIARDHDMPFDPKGTTEFTDWAALEALADEWAGGATG
ncbi:flavodoxin domain-containing protein [Pseudoponticoccus marisrubri]|uniref:Protoporphyrinogen oxidase n=1 Tax=Pseudoponticoccus marisrubri TaxID=1685382 RepID=A0A0W7WEX1_9RHOB|nr:flavodoxin domain-containing protein [Pseudoponticoccus marisrubri]KUF09016.1 protoporphyrinogen oxidase [Pseudoponticoccus marisrubri]